ncbi:MAG: DNA-binding response regulator [Calditrichaeota bacterium]|nr:MAG: DNA-binding response regulator [Calditrichota bacterium]
MKILVVEDEEKVAQVLKKGLSEWDYTVDIALSGEEALQKIGEENYDLVILDWLMPGMDGLAVCREIRERDKSLPILMLTAKDTVDDKVLGLETGADDYLTKPFSFEELKARIKALVRRSASPAVSYLEAGDLIVDPLSRKVTRGHHRIFLSNKEYELLLFLMLHKNKVVTRQMIAEQVWGIPFDTGTNYIDVYINYLRKKLNVGSRKPLIFTVRGKGYMLRDDDD